MNRILTFLLLIALSRSIVPGQAQNPRPEQADDVVRVNTELVQTDVTVLDRQGRFVDGLRPDQFNLNLNGQKRSISFFDRVTSGSASEASQLAAARSSAKPTDGSPAAAKESLSSVGRVILFVVDDVHLGGESLARACKTLTNFVDGRLSETDRVAIVSTSGQIGFLQQLTDNPVVLHTAIGRINFKRNTETYAGSTRISEYAASQVADAGNRQLFYYLMESVKLEYGMGLGALRGDHGNDSAGQARRLLKSRISQINAQAKSEATNTIAVLESLMESSAALPGRKLVFFLSDGFVVDPRGSNALDLLHQISQVAARTGAVIYSVDMKGNLPESAIDVSHNDYVDMTSRHAGVSLGEVQAMREPLSFLADETGGRTIVSSRGLDDELKQAVRETSDYYVLAWRPGSDNERNARAKVEVTIQGRPDLRVRLRRSYYVPSAPPQPANTKAAAATAPAPEVQLLSTLGAAHPLRTLPTSLSIGFTKISDSAALLQASMQIPREAFGFDPANDKQKSEVDVIGAAIDDRGLIYSFKHVLTVTAQGTEESPQVPVVWNQQLTVKPGLYQVRVAVRERNSGRAGSAMEWIEIPAMAPARLSMSSLFLGERTTPILPAAQSGVQPIRVDVDHRFARTSVLRFQTYVYNAAHDGGAPDVWIEARVLRGTQQVMAIAANKVPPDVSPDRSRLPYWSEIAVNDLSPGTYTLVVSASDKTAGTSALQKTKFSVD